MIEPMASRTCFVIFASLLLGAAACGSSAGGSVFTDPTADDGSGGRGTAANVFHGEGRPDPSLVAADGTDGGACAATSAEAKLTPVNMIVVYDRSGSMGDTQEDPSFDPSQRWIPVGQAMKAFFADPSSAGMSAALTFFPNATDSCQSTDYATANVPFAALPSTTFGQAIDQTAPKGDTPTRAATLGAIAQAKAVAQQKPAERTVIVLVTDGEPYGCGIDTSVQSDAEAQAVAQEVAAVKAQIPTYVIGVGPSVQNLDAVATAGGTTAFHVQVGNAQQTTTQLLAAMAQIRGALGRCDFDIPAPPDGRTLDFGKVNVEKTSGAGVTETLPYVADCTGGKGWHFDDPAKPKKVLLCSSTCESVKAEAGGKVNVSFRCVDRPDVVH